MTCLTVNSSGPSNTKSSCFLKNISSVEEKETLGLADHFNCWKVPTLQFPGQRRVIHNDFKENNLDSPGKYFRP